MLSPGAATAAGAAAAAAGLTCPAAPHATRPQVPNNVTMNKALRFIISASYPAPGSGLTVAGRPHCTLSDVSRHRHEARRVTGPAIIRRAGIPVVPRTLGTTRPRTGWLKPETRDVRPLTSSASRVWLPGRVSVALAGERVPETWGGKIRRSRSGGRRAGGAAG